MHQQLELGMILCSIGCINRTDPLNPVIIGDISMQQYDKTVYCVYYSQESAAINMYNDIEYNLVDNYDGKENKHDEHIEKYILDFTYSDILKNKYKNISTSYNNFD